MRVPIIAGNWKMNCTRAEAETLASGLLPLVNGVHGVEIVLCPPLTALTTVQNAVRGSAIRLAGQNMFWKQKGAYTGQVSAEMLLDAGCDYVIIGHSEPRGRFGVPEPDFDAPALAYFSESDSTVNRKVKAAVAARLGVICCVGETLAERQAGNTDDVVASQTERALADIDAESAAAIVLAYEPVWAIGTGEVCAADEADRVCGVIRTTMDRLYGDETAQRVRVQYGGSVKPDNAVDLLSRPNIDGALVGGASLKAADFAAIVAAAATQR